MTQVERRRMRKVLLDLLHFLLDKDADTADTPTMDDIEKITGTPVKDRQKLMREQEILKQMFTLLKVAHHANHMELWCFAFIQTVFAHSILTHPIAGCAVLI